MKKIKPDDLNITPQKIADSSNAKAGETRLTFISCGQACIISKMGTQCEGAGCTTDTIGLHCEDATLNEQCHNTKECPDTNNECNDTATTGEVCCAPDTKDMCPAKTDYCLSIDYCAISENCTEIGSQLNCALTANNCVDTDVCVTTAIVEGTC